MLFGNNLTVLLFAGTVLSRISTNRNIIILRIKKNVQWLPLLRMQTRHRSRFPRTKKTIAALPHLSFRHSTGSHRSSGTKIFKKKNNSLSLKHSLPRYHQEDNKIIPTILETSLASHFFPHQHTKAFKMNGLNGHKRWKRHD